MTSNSVLHEANKDDVIEAFRRREGFSKYTFRYMICKCLPQTFQDLDTSKIPTNERVSAIEGLAKREPRKACETKEVPWHGRNGTNFRPPWCSYRQMFFGLDTSGYGP